MHSSNASSLSWNHGSGGAPASIAVTVAVAVGSVLVGAGARAVALGALLGLGGGEGGAAAPHAATRATHAPTVDLGQTFRRRMGRQYVAPTGRLDPKVVKVDTVPVLISR